MSVLRVSYTTPDGKEHAQDFLAPVPEGERFLRPHVTVGQDGVPISAEWKPTGYIGLPGKPSALLCFFCLAPVPDDWFPRGWVNWPGPHGRIEVACGPCSIAHDVRPDPGAIITPDPRRESA